MRTSSTAASDEAVFVRVVHGTQSWRDLQDGADNSSSLQIKSSDAPKIVTCKQVRPARNRRKVCDLRCGLELSGEEFCPPQCPVLAADGADNPRFAAAEKCTFLLQELHHSLVGAEGSTVQEVARVVCIQPDDTIVCAHSTHTRRPTPHLLPTIFTIVVFPSVSEACC